MMMRQFKNPFQELFELLCIIINPEREPEIRLLC